jgi:hypothetical protein
MLCNEDENLEVCSLQSIRLVNVWLDSGLIYIATLALTRFHWHDLATSWVMVQVLEVLCIWKRCMATTGLAGVKNIRCLVAENPNQPGQTISGIPRQLPVLNTIPYVCDLQSAFLSVTFGFQRSWTSGFADRCIHTYIHYITLHCIHTDTHTYIHTYMHARMHIYI